MPYRLTLHEAHDKLVRKELTSVELTEAVFSRVEKLNSALRAFLHLARETALADGELIRAALEHQMIENDRSLIERMVQSFGRQAGVANVMLLDRQLVGRRSGRLGAGLGASDCRHHRQHDRQQFLSAFHGYYSINSRSLSR